MSSYRTDCGMRMRSALGLGWRTVLGTGLLLFALGCGSEPTENAPKAAAKTSPKAEAPPATPVAAAPVPQATQALALALAKFPAIEPGKPPVPLPASVEFLVPAGEGRPWRMVSVEDPQSNVVHKAMTYTDSSGKPQLLTAAGSEATLKLWSGPTGSSEPNTLWKKDFGGNFSRMRDVEIADLYGDGTQAMAVATHDQGIVAILRPDGKGGFAVEEIDREPDTFVHEIEIGDLDGDGVLEVYATPSEPNRLDGREQSGSVVRYVPAAGEGRVVVADLGGRHAKEILVEDVDGDGRDELYVAVEGKIDPKTKKLTKEVEIRRYDAGTDPSAGVVVATVPDRLSRFLTAGDIDGDGSKEMVVAAFSSGLWLLRPGATPSDPWEVASIDRNSGGFEHASILTDLDGDGKDELYVASDNDKLVRRYVWNGKRLVGEVIYRRQGPGSVFTWNVMPVPVELVP